MHGNKYGKDALVMGHVTWKSHKEIFPSSIRFKKQQKIFKQANKADTLAVYGEEYYTALTVLDWLDMAFFTVKNYMTRQSYPHTTGSVEDLFQNTSWCIYW